MSPPARARSRTLASSEVRWLPRRQATDVLLPANDFRLFDGNLLRVRHFAGDGSHVADEPSTDTETLKLCGQALRPSGSEQSRTANTASRHNRTAHSCHLLRQELRKPEQRWPAACGSFGSTRASRAASRLPVADGASPSRPGSSTPGRLPATPT
ncbi:DUF6879 family protein [Streptomyces sclerotialus]|uniref:DUF6879 family protein n=1 Tax=Streptomyces sclerotialus TaxID=1957 RepID=UPI0034A22216